MKNIFFIHLLFSFISFNQASANSSPLKCVLNSQGINFRGTWRLTDNTGKTRMETNFGSKKECEPYTKVNGNYFCSTVRLNRGNVSVIASLSENLVVGSVPYISKDSGEMCQDYLSKQNVINNKLCIADLHDWKVMDLSNGLVFELPFTTLKDCVLALEKDEVRITRNPRRPMYVNGDLFGRPIFNALNTMSNTSSQAPYSFTVKEDKGLDVYVTIPNECVVDINLSYWCPNKKINLPKGTVVNSSGAVHRIFFQRYGAWLPNSDIKFDDITFRYGEVVIDGMNYMNGFIPHRSR